MVQLLVNNRAWSDKTRKDDPSFFERLSQQQSPKYLWVGCSDSRVPANQILGLPPGEVFVHRNVGNQAMHTDMNLMSCLEYAVKELKVRIIIVCGHYGCGAVKAALRLPGKHEALVNCWISDIRECRNQHASELRGMESQVQFDRLCELNVLRQVFHVCTSPVVSSAWAQGQQVSVYGAVYSLDDGLMRLLVGPIRGGPGSDAREQFALSLLKSPSSSRWNLLDPDGKPLARDGEAAGPHGLSGYTNMMNTMRMHGELDSHNAWSAVSGVSSRSLQSNGP